MLDFVVQVFNTTAHANYPVWQVSREDLEKMKKQRPGIRGLPAYFSVTRKGLDFHVEVFPEEEENV